MLQSIHNKQNILSRIMALIHINLLGVRLDLDGRGSAPCGGPLNVNFWVVSSHSVYREASGSCSSPTRLDGWKIKFPFGDAYLQRLCWF